MPDDKALSKNTIAEAALVEFAEHGFAGARTDRIARRAGLNKQLIYYYFGSKEDLYASILDRAGALSDVEAIPEGSATEAIRNRLDQLTRFIADNAALTKVLVKGLQDADPRPAVTKALNRLVDSVALTISEGQGLGFFRDDVDPRLVSQQAIFLLLGHVVLAPAIEGPQVTPEYWMDRTLDLILPSITW